MLFNSLLMGLRARAVMQAEIIALRHQLAVLRRTPKIKAARPQSRRSTPVGLALTGLVALAFRSFHRQGLKPSTNMVNSIKRFLSEAGLISSFAMRAIRMAFQSPFELKEVVHQIYMVGWRSLPLVVTSRLAIGVALSMHTRATME
jgi:hypothetical protein